MIKELDKYRLIGDKPIGSGGMGAVWAAEDMKLSRTVAIKMLNSAYLANEDILNRFRQEAKAMASLNHAGIIQVYDFLEHGNTFGIVMEMAQGKTLEDVLTAAGGRIGLSQAISYTRQILDALNYAHQQGIVHRDIKPANIMISGSGSVKVMDFGIALLVGGSRLTQAGTTFGTPHYMSPEQIMNPLDIDHRTDVYSVGVMLYEMLAGVAPFGGESESDYVIKNAHLTDQLPPIRQKQPDVPSWMEKVLEIALAKDPAARFSGCSEFARSLENAYPPDGAISSVNHERYSQAGATVPLQKIIQPPPFKGESSSRSVLLYVVAGVAVVVLLTGGWFLLVPRGQKPQSVSTQQTALQESQLPLDQATLTDVVQYITRLDLPQHQKDQLIKEAMASKKPEVLQRVKSDAAKKAADHVVDYIATLNFSPEQKKQLIDEARASKDSKALQLVKSTADKAVADRLDAEKAAAQKKATAEKKSAPATNLPKHVTAVPTPYSKPDISPVYSGSSSEQRSSSKQTTDTACDKLRQKLELGKELNAKDTGYFVDNCK